MNTVTTSFNTTARQLIEMSQQKNDRNVPAKKKLGQHHFSVQ